MASSKDDVHLVWNMNSKDADAGIYHLVRTKGAFGRKTRIFTGHARAFQIALDPSSGIVIVAITTELDGVQLLFRNRQSGWTRPISLSAKVTDVDISLQVGNDGGFLVRTSGAMGEHQFAIRVDK